MLSATAVTREFRPPRRLRGQINDVVTSWDLLTLAQQDGPAREWADTTLQGIVAAADAADSAARGCADCADIGFYGLADARDPDLLVRLIKRRGENGYETLLSTGEWVPFDPGALDVEMIDVQTAGDLATVVLAGGSGLLRRWCVPLAFIGGDLDVPVTAAGELSSDTEDWDYYGIVDDVDNSAILDLIRVNATGVQRMIDGQWVDDTPGADLQTVSMSAAAVRSVVAQALPEAQTCEYCDQPATRRIIHSEGMAYIPVCDTHVDKGKSDAAACVPSGNPDPGNVNAIRPIKADAPLTVSPDPRAEKLRRYWSTGRGGAKIKWGLPSDWNRCYRHLRKYMGLRAKGYCQNLHKRNNGFWTGDRRNRGLLSSLPEEPTSPEHQLVASIQDGSWTQQEGTPAMSDDLLPDGIYCEASADDAVLRTLLAGGFPVTPPDSWFEDPKFTGPQPMTVDDSGQVHGHIATWDSIHIGMAGAVRAPKSRSGYAYFQTGQLKTDTGKTVNVGQLTLAGGHASLQADAQAAVKHYDDTNSAVADVHVGEDRYGIWAAGALRPDVTPEKLRTFRASPLSGDWRPINGNLELVAACAVNVPGFPIARARVASGTVQALVAAGAGPLAVIAAARTTETAIGARLDKLEQLVAGLAPAAPAEAPEVPAATAPDAPEDPEPTPTEPEDPPPGTPDEETEPSTTAEVPEVDGEKLPEVTDEQVAQMRAEIEDLRRAQIRDEVGELVSAGIPPQFLANIKKKQAAAKSGNSSAGSNSGSSPVGKGERPGIGGYPINNEQDLKNAIQAYGRARPEDQARTRKHIINRANTLGLSKLIPADWK